MKKSIGIESSILVVDDDHALLEMLSDQLHDHFKSVITTDRATKALDILKKHHIDCIITDYIMPEMNGLEFIAKLQVQFPDIPVLLLTGNGANPEVLKAIESGLFDYLDKPFKAPVLVNRIKNALLLPRLQSLLLDIVKADFPDVTVNKFLSASVEERLKLIAGLEAIIRTRLITKSQKKLA